MSGTLCKGGEQNTYDADFTKEKLFWMDMSDRGRFAYSDSEIYCNDIRDSL